MCSLKHFPGPKPNPHCPREHRESYVQMACSIFQASHPWLASDGQAPQALAHPLHVEALAQPAKKPFSSCQHEKSTTRAQHEYIRSHTPNRTGFYNKKQARPKEISRTLSSVALFLSSELPPSTPAVGYFLVFAALDTAKGSSSTITAQFSSTGQSSRHQAQKTHGIAGKKTHICKRQKQSCLFHVSAT